MVIAQLEGDFYREMTASNFPDTLAGDGVLLIKSPAIIGDVMSLAALGGSGFQFGQQDKVATGESVLRCSEPVIVRQDGVDDGVRFLLREA